MSNSKYPHCQLSMQRSIAPSSKWFWKVTMPDGQLYEASKGPLSFEDCVADMHLRGTTALDAADVIWRRNPAPIIAEQEKADAVFWGVGTNKTPDTFPVFSRKADAQSWCDTWNKKHPKMVNYAGEIHVIPLYLHPAPSTDRVAAKGGNGECPHEWVDARNQYVESGEFCLKCHAIRSGNLALRATPADGDKLAKAIGDEVVAAFSNLLAVAKQVPNFTSKGGRHHCSDVEFNDAVENADNFLQALHATPATAISLPSEINDALVLILGRMCFQCIRMAQLFRLDGMKIPTKAENEQAVVIHFLLKHYLADPQNWELNADRQLIEIDGRVRDAAAAAKQPGASA